ncbi:MAG: YchJ family protein [Gammaproteobacteria bacterium]|nr:YchJ family protein [Gammaproteobacteria bacterium]
MPTCPCGSGKTFSKCCEPYLSGKQSAPTAEALMRSRYTAFTKVDMEYLKRTHHPKTRSELDVSGTEQWAREAEWLGLEIINTEKGGADDTEGTVEFKASYRLNNEKCVLHELSRFERKQKNWMYLDGRLPDIKQYRRETPKVGRNDPCRCGSGKKYKKCCGGVV